MREIFETSPFSRYLGMTIESLDEGYARIYMSCRQELKQIQGIIHGGALASLADTAVGLALATMIETYQRINTIEMKINFLASIREGQVVAEARILRKGKAVAVGDVSIFDEHGKMVAKSLMSYSIRGTKQLP